MPDRTCIEPKLTDLNTMQYYYCGHCRPDSRYRDRDIQSVRRHITSTDNSRHKGHHGSNKAALVYSLEEDPDTIPIWEGFEDRFSTEAARLLLRAPHLAPPRVDDLVYGEDSDRRIATDLLTEFPWLEFERERLLVERTHVPEYNQRRVLATDHDERAAIQYIREIRTEDHDLSISTLNEELGTDFSKEDLKEINRTKYIPRTYCSRFAPIPDVKVLKYAIREKDRDILIAAHEQGWPDVEIEDLNIAQITRDADATRKPVNKTLEARYNGTYLDFDALRELPYSTDEIHTDISLKTMPDDAETEPDEAEDEDETITKEAGGVSYTGPSKGIDLTGPPADEDGHPLETAEDMYDPDFERDIDLVKDGLSEARRATIAYLRDNAPVEASGKSLLINDGEENITRTELGKRVGTSAGSISNILNRDKFKQYLPEPFGDWSPEPDEAEEAEEEADEIDVEPTGEIEGPISLEHAGRMDANASVASERAQELANEDDTLTRPIILVEDESTEEQTVAAEKQPTTTKDKPTLENDELVTLMKLAARDSTADEHDELLEKLGKLLE